MKKGEQERVESGSFYSSGKEKLLKTNRKEISIDEEGGGGGGKNPSLIDNNIIKE